MIDDKDEFGQTPEQKAFSGRIAVHQIREWAGCVAERQGTPEFSGYCSWLKKLIANQWGKNADIELATRHLLP